MKTKFKNCEVEEGYILVDDRRYWYKRKAKGGPRAGSPTDSVMLYHRVGLNKSGRLSVPTRLMCLVLYFKLLFLHKNNHISLEQY